MSHRPKRPVSRRDFLALGSLGVVGLSLAERSALAAAQSRSGRRGVILIIMSGGPSQLETFDPKPEAPREIRGPMRAIATSVPGVQLAEGLPRLAERMHRFGLIRSLHHEAAPIHETGLQLLQTGRITAKKFRPPSMGCLASRLLGSRAGMPAHFIVPGPMSGTGVLTYRGDGCGDACGPSPESGSESAASAVAPADVTVTSHHNPCEPVHLDDQGVTPLRRSGSPLPVDTQILSEFREESVLVREAYGETTFGSRLWQAARLIEEGTRFVTVNLFAHLEGQRTFDAHGSPSAPATIYDYRDRLGPQFDQACAALLDDLTASGLIDETLIVATGEFGRTPLINTESGRDHWTQSWSGLVAGAGVSGGMVLGSTDSTGREIVDQPIALEQLAATMANALRFEGEQFVSQNRQAYRVSTGLPIPEIASL